VLHILGQFLEVVELRPLRIHSPFDEHGLVAFTEALSDQSSGSLFICDAPLQIKEGFNLGMNLGQSTQRILVGIPQLTVHSGLGNHRPQVFGDIPFVPERAIGTAEHVAGELEGHCLIHAE
jgi:hypothetical protein